MTLGCGELGVRTYIAEPERGVRNWSDKQAEKEAVYANRRRGEKVERNFAHY